MAVRIKWLALVLLALLLLSSCQSNRAIKRLSKEGFMYAMIYDYENTPAPGVAVFLNGKKVADSDIHGRFVLENAKKGEYRITLSKKGYETLEESFSYDPMQVLYFKMINANQLLALAETALDSAEYAAAESFLNRALALEPSRPDMLFLKSIALYLQNRYAEARIVLEGLARAGSADPSVARLLERINNTEAREE